MINFFRNVSFQQQFNQDGYVVIPFLNNTTVTSLLNLYESVKDDHEITAPVHSTSDTDNPLLIREVDQRIRELTAKSVNDFFVDYNLFLTNFLIKEPGEDSVIYPHHDWTFVDETRYTSASIWCPLTDVNEKTGPISVLKGSHKFVETLRPSPDFPFAFGEVTDLLENYMEPLKLKAGEALVYNHAVIHSSAPNLSGQLRPVVVLAIAPAEAELYFYYHHTGPGKRKIEKFLVNTEFYYDYAKNSKPKKGKSLGQIDYTFKTLSRQDFLRLVKPSFLKPKPQGIIEKMKNIFKPVN